MGLQFPVWAEGLGWGSVRVGFAGLRAPQGLAGSVLSAKRWQLEAPRRIREDVGFELQCRCKAHTLVYGEVTLALVTH